MKIYFSASIRGGREQVDIYAQIIELLKNYGEVLTEHLGQKSLSSYGQVHITDEEIFERDIAWVDNADVLIAEVTTASLGVGYEIAHAALSKKKILCLYDQPEGKRLSAMINGNKVLMVKDYKTVEDVSEILKEFFK